MSSCLPPSDHSTRMLLQKLFHHSDAIDNEAAFLAAGFKIWSKKERSLMRVATYRALAGYVFKVFFVEEQGRVREKPCGWKSFTVRYEQAKRICRVIDEQAFRHFIGSRVSGCSVRHLIPRAVPTTNPRFSLPSSRTCFRATRMIVAEPLGLLVRVDVAADPGDQRGVVDDRARLLVQADPSSEPHRDQALAQHVLHRLARSPGRPPATAPRPARPGSVARGPVLPSDDYTGRAAAIGCTVGVQRGGARGDDWAHNGNSARLRCGGCGSVMRGVGAAAAAV